MDKEGAMEMVLGVLSDSKHADIPEDLLESFLNFGTKLLEGGNNRVQKTIYQFCTSYQRSEVMFRRFDAYIRKQTHKLKTHFDNTFYMPAQTVRAMHRFSTTVVDRPLDEAVIKEKDIHIRILEKLLRFLQLCTEGHYLELQDYIRDQKNNSNSYNLVTTVSELLLVYSSRMMQGDYENITKCLDTLTDFVQGPCPENQATLIESKFLEVAYKVLNVTFC